MKGRNRARVHNISRLSGFKQLVRGAARKSHKTVARQALKNKMSRVHALKILSADVQKEMKFLCSKRANSVLRATSEKKLSTFTWDQLAEELEEKAPTFYAMLMAFVSVKRRKRTKTRRPNSRCVSDTTVLGVCAGILLRHSNHHMNLVQRIIALILHSGHSAKEVIVTQNTACLVIRYILYRYTPDYRKCYSASLVNAHLSILIALVKITMLKS